MNTKYLFNSSGLWIAFQRGKYVFNTYGKWVGWIPWNDSDVVTPEGEYLGTITDRDRFYKFSYWAYHSYPGYPGYPGYAGFSRLPAGAMDLDLD
jgi:hypothetical protein